MTATRRTEYPCTTTMADMKSAIAEALGFMTGSHKCPDEVRARIAALRVPVEDVAGTRMTTDWRSAGLGGGGGWRPGPRRFEGGGGGGQRFDGPRRPYIGRAAAPRFGNKGRADVTTEERMMDRIRDKMNKFSSMTYAATKGWLSQLLDSGETGFLTEFITLVFEKAAAEEQFCALYARLITELCTEFAHLKSELQRIFGEFLDIFTEAAEEPDVTAAEYAAFVALRTRRRFRRGYAAFIGEIARLQILTIADIERTCGLILDGIMVTKVQEGHGMLCEEYADCLTALAKTCAALIKPTAAPLVVRVKEAMVRGPSLTNKARFALMDLVDLLA